MFIFCNYLLLSVSGADVCGCWGGVCHTVGGQNPATGRKRSGIAPGFSFSSLNENDSSNGTLGGQSNDEKVRTLGWKRLLEILSIRSHIWTLANQGVLGTRVPQIDFLDRVGGREVRQCFSSARPKRRQGSRGDRGEPDASHGPREERHPGRRRGCGACTRRGSANDSPGGGKGRGRGRGNPGKARRLALCSGRALLCAKRLVAGKWQVNQPPPPRHWPEASPAATQLASGAPSRARIGRGQGPRPARFGRSDWLAGRGRYPASASPPLVGGERGLGTVIGGRGAGPGPAGSGLVGK